MQIQDVKRSTPQKKSRQIGRGGKRGTTAGRGTKGQKARAGSKIRPNLRDQIKKIPKLRGYKFQSKNEKPTPVNLETIEKLFVDGASVNPASLAEKKIISRKGGRFPQVKVLGGGTIAKKVSVSGCLVSAAAREKIEKAGGKIN
ncbi:MAG TPA: uL15 family ribosomal protein [Candidatus Paceibacterota bacterium]|jgi:large subunit ribosomal protein L15|nr:uL15 family ribosomal protein [Candidatus Paceibacterota bacterium]HPN89312.1 uL15 family ribosomal protein [Candidatus Paceibacterota bacterium]HQF40835.1 uL15 family ribosomal protein [Candidatus Paceibacterota bacterium]